MARIRVEGVLFLLLISPIILNASQPQEKIVILHTNDMHSRLDGYAPSGEYTPLSINDDNTIGGFSRIASIIQNERSKSPENTLILDAGDFLMGTIYHHMEEYNGFQLSLMEKMGYDLVALGNHEFDFGPEKLAQIIEESVRRGNIPGLLLTNAAFSDDSKEDDGLEDLYKKDIIKRTTIIQKAGLKIGFFSLMGIDADDVAPFALPVTFSKQRKSARQAVKIFEREDVDIIICLSHSGLEKNKKGEWSGEDVKLAKKVKGIDLIISGHTHTELEKPLIVKGTPIVQTGDFGRNVGRLEISIVDGDLLVDDYKLLAIDDRVPGDPEIQAEIDIQKRLIEGKLFEPLGYAVSKGLVNSDFELVCDEYGGDLENSNLGPLVVDAIHKYINSNSKPGTDISMVAAGVIRDRIPPGVQSVQDIFRVMSLGSGSDSIPGYPLATVYLSGLELKRVVEILLVSSKSSPSNYCYYSGLEINYNPDKGLLKKVSSMSVVSLEGEKSEIDFDKKSEKLYSISANAYMLEFIGIIKKTTFGLINVLPKFADGSIIEDMSGSIIDFDSSLSGIQEGKEWIALVEYLKEMEDADGDGITELDDFYRSPPLRLIPVVSK